MVQPELVTVTTYVPAIVAFIEFVVFGKAFPFNVQEYVAFCKLKLVGVIDMIPFPLGQIVKLGVIVNCGVKS